MDKQFWTLEEDSVLKKLYSTNTSREIGLILGKSEASVRNRCWRLGLNKKKTSDWTEVECELIRRWYSEHDLSYSLDLDGLAKKLGRSRWGIAMKAVRLGLSDMFRSKKGGITDKRKFKGNAVALRDFKSQHVKDFWSEHGHPRGSLGMKHTDKAKNKIAKASHEIHLRRTPDEQERIIMKTRQTNIERYGTAAPAFRLSTEKQYTRGKGGRRADLGERYFRSRWEANYARYLNWLMDQGEILRWEYEPETYYFEGIRRGALSYTPDFRIYETNGDVVIHEVKGWMDDKSKVKLKRMAKYYPSVKIIVIGEEEYKAISRFSNMIPNWERGK